MSANNWRVCPRCKAAHAAAAREAHEAAAQAYGKVSEAAYHALIKDAEAKSKQTTNTDLREDWEIGMSEEGVFSVNYSCSCERCRFEYQIQERRVVPIMLPTKEEVE